MAKHNMADLSGKSNIYITPETILDPVRNYFGGPIPLDPATQPDNPTKALHYACGPGTPEPSLGDGLVLPWSDYPGTFLNPPFSGGVMKTWCEKIHDETVDGASILALLPCGARFATRYWQDHIFNPGLDVGLFVRGRVQFRRPDGSGTTGQNPYDSQLLGFGVDVDRFFECFQHLGKVVEMRVM